MKPKVLNLHVFNMITGINKSRTLIKHISCKCECKYDGRKCMLHRNWTNDKSQCECKNLTEHRVWQVVFWNPVTCNCKNGKYAGSITGDPVDICDEIIDTVNSTSTKTVPTKTVPAKCTLRNFFILLCFSIIDSC